MTIRRIAPLFAGLLASPHSVEARARLALFELECTLETIVASSQLWPRAYRRIPVGAYRQSRAQSRDRCFPSRLGVSPRTLQHAVTPMRRGLVPSCAYYIVLGTPYSSAKLTGRFLLTPALGQHSHPLPRATYDRQARIASRPWKSVHPLARLSRRRTFTAASWASPPLFSAIRIVPGYTASHCVGRCACVRGRVTSPLDKPLLGVKHTHRPTVASVGIM